MNPHKLQAIEYGLNTFLEIGKKVFTTENTKVNLIFQDENGDILTANFYREESNYPIISSIQRGSSEYRVHQETVSYLPGNNTLFNRVRRKIYRAFDMGWSSDYFEPLVNNPELLLEIIIEIIESVDFDNLEELKYLYNVEYLSTNLTFPFIKYPNGLELVGFKFK